MILQTATRNAALVVPRPSGASTPAGTRPAADRPTAMQDAGIRDAGLPPHVDTARVVLATLGGAARRQAIRVSDRPGGRMIAQPPTDGLLRFYASLRDAEASARRHVDAQG